MESRNFPFLPKEPSNYQLDSYLESPFHAHMSIWEISPSIHLLYFNWLPLPPTEPRKAFILEYKWDE